MPSVEERLGVLETKTENIERIVTTIADNQNKQFEYCRKQTGKLASVETRSGFFGVIGGFCAQLLKGVMTSG